MPNVFACIALSLVAVPAVAGPLRVGAARLDITPGAGESLRLSGYAARKEGHKGIHDNLYVRALVLEDGSKTAAIVTADLIGFSHDFWDRISGRIEKEAGIPRQNLLLAATHTHAAPSLGTYGENLEGSQAAYVARVEQALLQVVSEAKGNIQPGRAGAATGRANVNVNRRARMGDGAWWLGINPDGPSDKTVGVVRFETLSGAPVAFLINYAVHGTGMGQENYQISADVSGATSRFVEEQFGDEVVALWTSGAAGDQCPIYDRSAARFDGVRAIGRLLGEEALRAGNAIRTLPEASLDVAQRIVICPGHRLTPGPRVREKYVWEDADPVPIRLSMLRINDILLGGVSGEVLTMIGQRFKKESGLKNAMMITHCNGSSGYLPDDAAYDQVSYEIQVSRVKRGCAENAIVNGLLEMMATKRR